MKGRFQKSLLHQLPSSKISQVHEEVAILLAIGNNLGNLHYLGRPLAFHCFLLSWLFQFFSENLSSFELVNFTDLILLEASMVQLAYEQRLTLIILLKRFDWQSCSQCCNAINPQIKSSDQVFLQLHVFGQIPCLHQIPLLFFGIGILA